MKRITCNRCGTLLQTELTKDQCYFTIKVNSPFCEIKFDKEQMQELVDKVKAEVLASIDRPQGFWAEFEGGYRCSNCDDIEAYTPNFCPNCGAKMKGGAE